MDDFWKTVVQQVFNAAGAVGVILLLGNVYQAWLLKQERDERYDTRVTAKEEGKERGQALNLIGVAQNKTAEAMHAQVIEQTKTNAALAMLTTLIANIHSGRS